MIEKLRQTLDQVLFEPAIKSDIHPNAIKTLKSTRTKLSHFKKVGDLYKYYTKVLNYGDEKGKGLFLELKENSLKTFEDFLPEFQRKFSEYLDDCTELEDLTEGQVLTKIEIGCLANNFNQFSGMLEIKFGEVSQGIISTITIGGDKYNNQWLDEGKLKYYPQKRKEQSIPQVSKLAFSSRNVPFYIFEKIDDNQYRFAGKFEKERAEDEFLILNKIPNSRNAISAEYYFRKFNNTIKEGANKTIPELLSKLSEWESSPQDKYVIVKHFNRNPYVKSFALIRAQGECERCKKKAPFERPDKTPYLEVHHLKLLSQDGGDSINNVIALCPNCHRQMHFGEIASGEIHNLLNHIAKKNSYDNKLK